MSIAHLACQLLALAAFACLALAMDRHQDEVFGRQLPTRHTRWLRAGGWSLLLLSLIVALGGAPMSLGLVAWFGHISAAAGLVVLTLVVRSRWR